MTDCHWASFFCLTLFLDIVLNCALCPLDYLSARVDLCCCHIAWTSNTYSEYIWLAQGLLVLRLFRPLWGLVVGWLYAVLVASTIHRWHLSTVSHSSLLTACGRGFCQSCRPSPLLQCLLSWWCLPSRCSSIKSDTKMSFARCACLDVRIFPTIEVNVCRVGPAHDFSNMVS